VGARVVDGPPSRGSRLSLALLDHLDADEAHDHEHECGNEDAVHGARIPSGPYSILPSIRKGWPNGDCNIGTLAATVMKKRQMRRLNLSWLGCSQRIATLQTGGLDLIDEQ